MEGIVINHQRRRRKIKAQIGFEADHIIPYCICMDDSKENIQFLRRNKHREKTIIDFKIIKEFRNKNWIEKITHYSHELKVPISQLKKEYLIRFKELNDKN